MKNKKQDLINHPSHYTQGIECADYVYSHKMCFFQGNAIKYLTRYKHKGTPLQDLEKARWYINYLINQHQPVQKRKYTKRKIKKARKAKK
jgi:hypothetical protein